MQLVTPSTASTYNNLREQVRKPALLQQKQHGNNYRGTSNRCGRDGGTAINDDDDYGNDASAVDTVRRQPYVKLKKGFLPRQRESKVGLLTCELMEAQPCKHLQIKRTAEKQEQEQLMYEQQMKIKQQELEYMEQHKALHVVTMEDGHLAITHSAPAPEQGSG